MKYLDFKKAINKPYFSWQDIRLKNLKIFNYQLSLWKKRGDILRLKRGLFVFSEEKENLSIQEASFLLCEPSYISLESVLSHYGFIPEMVYSITSVTPKTTKKFKNDFGNFIYHHIKPDLFFGYVSNGTEYGKYLMAEPEKALLDFLYLKSGEIENENDVSELRLNVEEMKKIIDMKKLSGYAREFNIAKMNKLINLIFKNADFPTA